MESRESSTRGRSEFNARIADFGLSNLLLSVAQEIDLKSFSGPRGSDGSVRWMAPEYISGFSTKHMPGDVYAWACVVLEVSARIIA